jgi:hypothetical protein
MIDHGIGVIAHRTGMSDDALQSITGVIAYGVRVSAYGVRVSAYGYSHQWLRRPRKRLRPGLEHTGRSARSGGSHSAGLAPREARCRRPSTLRTSAPESRKITQDPDVTRILAPSGARSRWWPCRLSRVFRELFRPCLFSLIVPPRLSYPGSEWRYV